MDSFSLFRSLLSEKLSGRVTRSAMGAVLSCLDELSSAFTITTKTDQPADGLPDPLRFFLAAKTVEEKSPRTIRLYACILSRFFQTVTRPLREISTEDIRAYLSARRQAGNKAVTVGNIRRILSSFFEWCALEGFTPANPVRRITTIRSGKSPRKALKRIEVEQLRSSCESLRDKAMIDFLYSTGVRVSEFCSVKTDQVDWERKAVLIEHGKGDVTRWTYLNPEAEVSLRAYLDSRRDDSPFLFTTLKGSPSGLSPRTVQNTVDRIVSRSGRRYSVRISPHVFRHTIATVLLQNGMPVEQVQRFLGHANVNTTLIYAEVRDEDVRRAHQMYAA